MALALEFIPARPLARCQETTEELHFLARAILCVGQVGNLSYVFLRHAASQRRDVTKKPYQDTI